MSGVFIFHAKRSAIGRFAGALSPMRPDDMMAALLTDFKQNHEFALEEIDDVLIGCANQAGEDNRNVARMSLTLAQFPFAVPGVTINRLCGSSLDAATNAFAQIKAGHAQCLLVGGVESMSRAPYVMSKGQTPFDRGQQIWDTAIGWRFPNSKMEELFPLYSMGETAEEVATLYKISREEQDQFAFECHQKALAAMAAGDFKEEIIPLEIKLKKKSYLMDQDEGPRKETSLEKLKTLRPVFRSGGSVTAGNASSINDGAALLGIASEDFIKKNNLTPLVEIIGGAVRGCHPNTMGLGPIEASKRLCQQYGHKLSDFDIVELNEAFAAQSLACIRELELDPAKVNIKGGAIALGHPLGASGARILTTLAHQMKAHGQLTLGLASMCIGVGQGVSIAVRNAH